MEGTGTPGTPPGGGPVVSYETAVLGADAASAAVAIPVPLIGTEATATRQAAAVRTRRRGECAGVCRPDRGLWWSSDMVVPPSYVVCGKVVVETRRAEAAGAGRRRRSL